MPRRDEVGLERGVVRDKTAGVGIGILKFSHVCGLDRECDPQFPEQGASPGGRRGEDEAERHENAK